MMRPWRRWISCPVVGALLAALALGGGGSALAALVPLLAVAGVAVVAGRRDWPAEGRP